MAEGRLDLRIAGEGARVRLGERGFDAGSLPRVDVARSVAVVQADEASIRHELIS